MARHDGDLTKGDFQPLPLEELLEMIGRPAPSSDSKSRQDARACYLSSSDGWAEAARHLGGAFAEEIAALTVPKGE